MSTDKNKELEKIGKANAHIPTKEVKQDIADTQSEINAHKKEKHTLMKYPQENKVRIYMLGGKINKKTNFVNKLNQILEYRND